MPSLTHDVNLYWNCTVHEKEFFSGKLYSTITSKNIMLQNCKTNYTLLKPLHILFAQY